MWCRVWQCLRLSGGIDCASCESTSWIHITSWLGVWRSGFCVEGVGIKAQGPSRTCNESKEEEEKITGVTMKTVSSSMSMCVRIDAPHLLQRVRLVERHKRRQTRPNRMNRARLVQPSQTRPTRSSQGLRVWSLGLDRSEYSGPAV